MKPIRRNAEKYAGKNQITQVDAILAIHEFFKPLEPEELTQSERIFKSLGDNKFLIACILMTLVFGALGYSLAGGQPEQVAQSKAFLDIAKVFAGAIVGSAAGSGFSRRRTATSRQ